MKLLFLIPEAFNGERWGGVTTYTVIMAKALARIGHEVEIVTPGNMRQTIRRQGYCIRTEPCPDYPGRLTRIIRRTMPEIADRINWMAACYRYWKRYGPYDIVEYPEWGSSGLFIRLFTRQRCVCRLHRSSLQTLEDNAIPPTLEDHIINLIEMTGAVVADATSSPTRYMYRSHPRLTRLLGLLGKRRAVIPYGLEIYPRSGGVQSPCPTPYILYVGRIERGKGCETLVRAFKRIHAIHPRLKLIMVGEDTRYPLDGLPPYSFSGYLRTLSRKANLTGCIEFAGKKSQHDLASYYRHCLCTVVPSFGNDNMPFSALDAIRFAKPLIASATGGLPEFMMDGTNCVAVEPGDTDSLVHALLRIIRDGKLRQRLVRNNGQDSRMLDTGIVAPKQLIFYGQVAGATVQIGGRPGRP